MKSQNHAHLIGYVSFEPEIREFPDNKISVCFNVCVDDSFRNTNGILTEKKLYFRIICWGNLAANTARYLKKGRHVAVSGSLNVVKFENDYGKGKIIEIRAEDIHLVGNPMKKINEEIVSDDAK